MFRPLCEDNLFCFIMRIWAFNSSSAAFRKIYLAILENLSEAKCLGNWIIMNSQRSSEGCNLNVFEYLINHIVDVQWHLWYMQINPRLNGNFSGNILKQKVTALFEIIAATNYLSRGLPSVILVQPKKWWNGTVDCSFTFLMEI